MFSNPRALRRRWFTASVPAGIDPTDLVPLLVQEGITDLTWGPSPYRPAATVMLMYVAEGKRLTEWFELLVRMGCTRSDQIRRMGGGPMNVIDWAVIRFAQRNAPATVEAFQRNRVRITRTPPASLSSTPHNNPPAEDDDDADDDDDDADMGSEAGSGDGVQEAMTPMSAHERLDKTLARIREALGGIAPGPILAMHNAPLQVVRSLCPVGFEKDPAIEAVLDVRNDKGAFARCPRFHLEDTSLDLHREAIAVEDAFAKACDALRYYHEWTALGRHANLSPDEADEVEYLLCLQVGEGPTTWTAAPAVGGGVVGALVRRLQVLRPIAFERVYLAYDTTTWMFLAVGFVVEMYAKQREQGVVDGASFCSEAVTVAGMRARAYLEDRFFLYRYVHTLRFLYKRVHSCIRVHYRCEVFRDGTTPFRELLVPPKSVEGHPAEIARMLDTSYDARMPELRAVGKRMRERETRVFQLAIQTLGLNRIAFEKVVEDARNFSAMVARDMAVDCMRLNHTASLPYTPSIRPTPPSVRFPESWVVTGEEAYQHMLDGTLPDFAA